MKEQLEKIRQLAEAELAECQKLADEAGVTLKIREYISD